MLSLKHRKMRDYTKRSRSRTGSKKIRKFYTEEDYFDRLPSGLIISIFERILDAKCLCICYSVSKYFAAHVVQTRFVSVEIPRKIGQSYRFRVWPQVKDFLKKLRCVESATIQFSLDDPSSKQMSNPLDWWKSDSFGFIFLHAKGRVDDDDIPSPNAMSKYDHFPRIMIHLVEFQSRFLYVQELLVILPNLKFISAVDSMKQGNLVLGEEGIASIKEGKQLESSAEWCRKVWVAPKASLSGCELKNVSLVLGRYSGASDSFVADNLLEENEYRQLAMTMMENRAIHESRYSSPGRIADVPPRLMLKAMIRNKIYKIKTN